MPVRVLGLEDGRRHLPFLRVTVSSPRLLWRLARRAVDYAWRELDYEHERRRMNRVRRDPAELTTVLKAAKTVLFVCHGNIIRSAFAARLVVRAVGDRPDIRVASGGLEALAGRPAHALATAVAAAHGLDLGDHGAVPVTPESVAEADLIFVMEIPHLVVMRKRFPAARGKTFLLTCLVPDALLEVADPVNEDEPVFQMCFDHIARAVAPLGRILGERPEPRSPVATGGSCR